MRLLLHKDPGEKSVVWKTISEMVCKIELYSIYSMVINM